MNIWPQRTKIRDLVREYRHQHGLTPEGMAKLLGVSPSHLHGLLYDKRTQPSLESAQAFARVLQVAIADVVGDEGNPPVNHEISQKLSAEENFWLNAMGSDLTKLTPEQRRAAFDAWSAIVRGYQASKT